MEKNPLVSICIPVHNGGLMIKRALESAINQTYKNIEVVVSDNASTDNTKELVLSYASRDPRIKYFGNEVGIGPFENFLRSFRLAKGEFIQLLGHDDWLSRNRIEEAMEIFSSHPEIAAVFAKYISYFDNGDGLKFDQVVTMEPGFYSARDYYKEAYKSTIAYFSIYSVIRAKDLIEAADFTQRFFADPPKDIPEEFRDLCIAGFGIDIMVFFKIMPKYESLFFAKDSAFVKITRSDSYGGSAGKLIDMNKAVGILNNYDFFRTCHEFVYKKDLKKYLWGLKFFIGVETLTSLILFYIKKKFPKPFFESFSFGRMNNFFRNYSFWEVVAVILWVAPHFVKRLIKAAWIRLRKRKDAIYGYNIFLDERGNFKV